MGVGGVVVGQLGVGVGVVGCGGGGGGRRGGWGRGGVSLGWGRWWYSICISNMIIIIIVYIIHKCCISNTILYYNVVHLKPPIQYCNKNRVWNNFRGRAPGSFPSKFLKPIIYINSCHHISIQHLIHQINTPLCLQNTSKRSFILAYVERLGTRLSA